MIKQILDWTTQIIVWFVIIVNIFRILENRKEYKHLVELSARTDALNSELETLTKKMKFTLNPLDMIQKDWPKKVVNDKR